MSQEACPRCGDTCLVVGVLESTGQIRFRPAQTRFFTFRTSDISIRAQMCSACGNLVMTGNTSKLRQINGVPTQTHTTTQNVGP